MRVIMNLTTDVIGWLTGQRPPKEAEDGEEHDAHREPGLHIEIENMSMVGDNDDGSHPHNAAPPQEMAGPPNDQQLANLNQFNDDLENVSIHENEVAQLIDREGLSPRHREGNHPGPWHIPTEVPVTAAQIPTVLASLREKTTALQEAIDRLEKTTNTGLHGLVTAMDRMTNTNASHAIGQVGADADLRDDMDELTITVQELTDQFKALKHTVAANDTNTNTNISKRHRNTLDEIEGTSDKLAAVIEKEVLSVIKNLNKSFPETTAGLTGLAESLSLIHRKLDTANLDQLNNKVDNLAVTVAGLKRSREEESTDQQTVPSDKRRKSNEHRPLDVDEDEEGQGKYEKSNTNESTKSTISGMTEMAEPNVLPTETHSPSENQGNQNNLEDGVDMSTADIELMPPPQAVDRRTNGPSQIDGETGGQHRGGRMERPLPIQRSTVDNSDIRGQVQERVAAPGKQGPVLRKVVHVDRKAVQTKGDVTVATHLTEWFDPNGEPLAARATRKHVYKWQGR